MDKEILRTVFIWWRFLFWCWLPLFLSAETAISQDIGRRTDPFPAHVDTAVSYFGSKELKKENHGPDIKKFLGSVGLPEGYPYCAAFNSYCLEAAGADYPKVRSAMAQAFITDRSIEAKKVMRGYVEIPAGSIHVMKKGNTSSGHTGFVLLRWSGRSGIVIDANTGTGLKGESEREGQGVWIRRRTIYPTCYFCVDYFTPVEY